MTRRTEFVTVADAAATKGLAGGPFGSTLGRRDYVPAGVPVIRGQNLKSRFVSFEDCVYVTPEKVDNELSRNLALPGDIVFTQRGTLGQVSMVPDDAPERSVVSQSQMRLRVNRARADPLFAYYQAISPAFQDALHLDTVVTGVPHINLGLLAETPLWLPPLCEQQRIASVLGAFDDLIETNQGTIMAMEQLIQGLFERGQFDRPLNGEPSTLIGSLVEVNPPIAKPRGEAAYVEMAMLPTNGALLPPPGRRPAQGGARFSNGDALLARITPCLENGKTAYVTNLRAGEVGVGSTEFIVFRGHHRTKGVWAYCLARSSRFRTFAIQQLGDGTSGRQRLSADAVANYRLAVPDDVELARFQAAAEPLVEGMVDLHEEALELTRQRDELLPLLMAGKVRVSEVEGVA